MTRERVQRGQRVRDCREELGLGQEQFADRMNKLAAANGLPSGYDKSKLSKIETGVRDLSLEDVAVLELLAPRRGWKWFAFGRGGIGAPRTQEELAVRTGSRPLRIAEPSPAKKRRPGA
jgi:hypothetical protein